MNREPSSVSSYPSVGEFAADDSPRSQSIGSLPQSQNGTPQPVLNDGYSNFPTENQLYRGLSPNDVSVPYPLPAGERLLSIPQRQTDPRFLQVQRTPLNQSVVTQQPIGSNQATLQRPIALPLLHMPPPLITPLQLVPHRPLTQMQLPQFPSSQQAFASSQRESYQQPQVNAFRPIAGPFAGRPVAPPPPALAFQQSIRPFDGQRPIAYTAARQFRPPLLRMPPPTDLNNNNGALSARFVAALPPPPPPPRLLPPELVMGYVHAKQAEELQRQQQTALESSLKAAQNIQARPPPPLPLLTMPLPTVTQRPPLLIPSPRPPAPPAAAPPAAVPQPPPPPQETSEEMRDVDLDNVLKQLNDGYLLKPGLVSELLMKDTGERRPRGVNWLTAKHEDVERELEHEVLLKSLLEKEQLVQTLKRDRHLLETQVQQQQQQMASSMPLAMPPVAPPEVYLSRSTRAAAESAPPSKRGDVRLLNVMDIEAPESGKRAGAQASSAKKLNLSDHLADLLDRIGRERREGLARDREPNPLTMRVPSAVELRERPPPPPPAEPPLVDEMVSARAVADERAVPQQEPVSGGDALTARLLQSEPVKDERVIEDALQKARSGAEKSEVSRTLVGMDVQLRAMEQLSARLDEDMRVAQQRVLVAEQLARSESAVARQLEDPRLFERTHGARSTAVTFAGAIGRAEARDRSQERPLKAPNLREIMGIRQTCETAVETLPPAIGEATQTTPRVPERAEEPTVVEESVAPPKSAAEIDAERRRAKIRERIDRLLKGKTVSPREDQLARSKTRAMSGSAPPPKSRALSPERQAQMQEAMRKHEESAYRLVMGSLEDEAQVKRQLAALQSGAPRGRQTATDHIVREVRSDKKRQSALDQRNLELKRRVVAKTTVPKQPEDVGERSMSREEYETFLDRMVEESPSFDSRQRQPKPAKPLEEVVAMRRPEALRKQHAENVKHMRAAQQQQRPSAPDAQKERTRSPPRMIGSPVASAKPSHENWTPKTEQRPRQSVPYVELLKRGRPPPTAARSSSAERPSTGQHKGPVNKYVTREVHSALSPQETPRDAVAAVVRRTTRVTGAAPSRGGVASPSRQQQSASRNGAVQRAPAPEAGDISEMSEWTVSDDVKRLLREPDTGRSLETANSEQFSRDAEWDAAPEPAPARAGGSSVSTPKRATRAARDADERSATPSIIDWGEVDGIIDRENN